MGATMGELSHKHKKHNRNINMRLQNTKRQWDISMRWKSKLIIQWDISQNMKFKLKKQ